MFSKRDQERSSAVWDKAGARSCGGQWALRPWSGERGTRGRGSWGDAKRATTARGGRRRRCGVAQLRKEDLTAPTGTQPVASARAVKFVPHDDYAAVTFSAGCAYNQGRRHDATHRLPRRHNRLRRLPG